VFIGRIRINDNNQEVLSYIEGVVPHDMPAWIWNKSVIEEIALAQRHWHDATEDFDFRDGIWQIETNTNFEVICHNDFAPYNVVFKENQFKGLIDFDLCSPGSRLWDLSNTLYRFIPVMPCIKEKDNDEVSPFDVDEVIDRLDYFIKTYSKDQNKFEYSLNEVLKMISIRLMTISDWTLRFATQTNNENLLKNSDMYKRHSIWVNKLIQ